MKWNSLTLLSVLLIGLGCGMDHIDNPFPDDSVDYFPLGVGKFITYQVDSIVFDDAPGGNTTDTIHFQLREEIVSANALSPGDTIFYLLRLRRTNENEDWKASDLWTASRSTAEALRTEENLKFRKLNFPLRFGRRWDPLDYINPSTAIRVGTETMKPYEGWEAEVTSFDRSGQIGDFTFPNGQVMQVQQVDLDDGVMKRYACETYVRNIGLVAKTEILLDSRCIELGDFGPCLGKPWEEHANKGYILSQTMTDHN